MRLLIRADDVGYSEAVNYGIAKSVREGLAGSVGVMPNMPYAAQGLALLEGTGVCVGQHTNICLGKPCADPALIPSLLDEQGNLISSSRYRAAYKQGEEFTVLDEMVLEVEAQYKRFLELTGQEPDYFEAHAVMNNNLFKALEIVSERYNLKYNNMTPADKVGYFHGVPVAAAPMLSTAPGEYDPFACLQDALRDADPTLPLVFVCHPGYLDDFILRNSSLTVNRTKEVAMLCDPAVKAWLDAQGVQLITYRDI